MTGRQKRVARVTSAGYPMAAKAKVRPANFSMQGMRAEGSRLLL